MVCACLVLATPDIQCLHDRDQLLAVLNTVMNFLLPQEARYFRTSLPVVSFSRRHLELNGKRLKTTAPVDQVRSLFLHAGLSHTQARRLCTLFVYRYKSLAYSTCLEFFSSGGNLLDLRLEQLVFLDPLDTPSL